MTQATQDEIYEYCPFCQEANVDANHLTSCSVRDALLIGAQYGVSFPDFADMIEKISKIKMLCDTYEHAPKAKQDRMWCCHECYVFGEGVVPDVCPTCKSLATSPASIFTEASASS